jgi:hypothetical protein
MRGAYSLFTLVGIAGEDDLDAPDLMDPAPETGKPKINSKSGGNGAQQPGSARPAGRDAGNKSASVSLHCELSTALSASLRVELLRQIAGLNSADEAALWAQQRLAAKNQLSAADAQRVEEAFAAKLGVVSTQGAKADDVTTVLNEQSSANKPPQIDKSVLGFPEPRRIRDRDHIRHVLKQSCLICGRRPSDPHHLRLAQSRALGRKVSDEFTVPLCRTHHREIHRCGDEESWWQNSGTDPLAAARALWLETHPLPRAEAITGNNEAAANAPRYLAADEIVVVDTASSGFYFVATMALVVRTWSVTRNKVRRIAANKLSCSFAVEVAILSSTDTLPDPVATIFHAEWRGTTLLPL